MRLQRTGPPWYDDRAVWTILGRIGRVCAVRRGSRLGARRVMVLSISGTGVVPTGTLLLGLLGEHGVLNGSISSLLLRGIVVEITRVYNRETDGR